MTPQTEQEIEKLKTLNDNYTALVDIFDHLVPREYVVLTLSAPSDVDWTMYSVVVINNDKGTSDTYAIPSNGVLEFEVKYDTTYTIKLPILGDFIAPKDLTFTAGMKMREVVYSYLMIGIFAMDANGRCYTIEQCEALEDKSIIVAGCYTDKDIENSIKDNGGTGNGFMWDIKQELFTGAFASSNVEFDQSLLPFLTSDEMALPYCDGEAYTNYMLSEAARLGITSPIAESCISRALTINKIQKQGFLPAYGQLKRLAINISYFNALYTALGLTAPTITSNRMRVSCQFNREKSVYLKNGNFASVNKTDAGIYYALCCFSLY